MPIPILEQPSATHPEREQKEEDAHFWYALVNEIEAAHFLGVSVRSMQGFRYRGGGPRFIRISGRCIKYRRIDLRAWSERRLCTSTSDPGMAGER